MICNCPYCGFALEKWLKNGMSSCSNCHLSFDSCNLNKLLAAAWTARKRHVSFVEELGYLELPEEVSQLLQTYVIDNCMSHDELLKTGIKTFEDFKYLNSQIK